MQNVIMSSLISCPFVKNAHPVKMLAVAQALCIYILGSAADCTCFWSYLLCSFSKSRTTSASPSVSPLGLQSGPAEPFSSHVVVTQSSPFIRNPWSRPCALCKESKIRLTPSCNYFDGLAAVCALSDRSSGLERKCAVRGQHSREQYRSTDSAIS